VDRNSPYQESVGKFATASISAYGFALNMMDLKIMRTTEIKWHIIRQTNSFIILEY